MKIRNGFVSNSSSSSFLCSYCGTIESGMDMSRSEAGMVECENGHTFCESHMLPVPHELIVELYRKEYDKTVKYFTEQLAEYKDKKEKGELDWRGRDYASSIESTEDHLKYLANEYGSREDADIDINDFESICNEIDEFYVPEQSCPVCAKIKAKQAEREANTSDPDWEVYVKLYGKFKGISPS